MGDLQKQLKVYGIDFGSLSFEQQNKEIYFDKNEASFFIFYLIKLECLGISSQELNDSLTLK